MRFADFARAYDAVHTGSTATTSRLRFPFPHDKLGAATRREVGVITHSPKTTTEFGPWNVVTRINKAGNLTLEISLDGTPHAEVILQEGGMIDLSGRITPWDIGEKGWQNPGGPGDDFRKFRFGPSAVPEAAS